MRIRTSGMLAVAVLSVMSAPADLIRHYLFDEGRGDEVINHAPAEPGRRAVTGGPLGSMEITYRSPYGTGSVEAYAETTRYVETDWCEGRYPGKLALRVGTRPIGLYRSGVTGAEFANGLTFAGWIKFSSRGEARISRAEPLRLSDGYTGDGLSLTWSEASWAPEGELVARFGRPKDAACPDGAVVLSLKGCESEVWHAYAITLDGQTARLTLDGRSVEAPFEGPLRFKRLESSWSGQQPFLGTTRTPYLHIGNVRDARNAPNPFVLDELAIFDRALSADEIASFLNAKPAAGTPDRQRAASAAERARRAAHARIRLAIPEDSQGYFRVGEEIPVTVTGVSEGTLRIRAVSTYGRQVIDRRVPVTAKAKNGPLTTISFDRCEAYAVELALLDRAGKTVKEVRRPYLVGIVPKAPDHLNSPFGFWACTDSFSYDSNLRRMMMPWFLEGYGPLPAERKDWIGYKEFVRYRDIFLNRQRIPAEDLRLYSALPHACHKDANIPETTKAQYLTCFKWVAETAKEFGLKEFEVTSEVDGRTSPEAYMWNLEQVCRLVTAEVPDAVFYPPGATPCALPFINKILELGAWKHAVGISHHNYLSTPVHNFYWDNPGKRLKEIVDRHAKAHGKPLRLFNTESGVFSLPYVHARPMTREHARAAGYSISQIGGYETYNTSMPTLPDDEAAAVQVHAIFVNLASGYEMYVKCQTPCLGAGDPCRQGVALTALSGQVLNDMTGVGALPMSSLKTMAVLVRRTHPKTGAKSTALAVFGMENRRFTFKAEPSKTYRTMDLLGNFGTVRTDACGILTIDAKLEPQYVFDVPADVAELTPMKLVLPAVLPESGEMTGTVVLENPFGVPLKGRLAAEPLRGAEIAFDASERTVAPGARIEIPFTLTARSLKRRNYPVRFSFGRLAAEGVFASQGLIYTLPRVRHPLALDGDEAKWRDVPEFLCETEDDVVHGKPNFAELWLPQWGNRDDLSVKVRACYVRDDAIYFRLDVTDQRVVTAPADRNGLAFNYDCLELFIDTRTGRALGSPVDFGADQVIVPAVDTKKLGKSPLWYAKREKAHIAVETVGRATAKGWMLEGRIVPTAASDLRLRPGSRIMMDFVIDDCDDLSVVRKAAMAVHGTLENNSNAAAWGRYELGL